MKKVGLGLPEDRSAVLRILGIHRDIARGSCPSVRQLAERYEVSLRTIQRDLEGLRDRLGAPLEYDTKRRGYRYSEKYRLPPLELTEGEVVALVLGAGLLSRFRGTPFQEHVDQALDKVTYLFPDHISADLGTIDQVLTFDEAEIRGLGPKLEENLTLIERAIRDCVALEIIYYTPRRDAHTVRRIAPHHVHIMGGAIYVIAYCYLRQEMRTFALDRMEHVTRTDGKFQRRADFSIRRYLEGSWGIERGEKASVTVHFEPETARFIRERQWHPSQVIEDQPDGSILTQFEVAVTGEFVRWVRQYGAQAEVVAPEWLREEMRAEAERVSRLYSKVEGECAGRNSKRTSVRDHK